MNNEEENITKTGYRRQKQKQLTLTNSVPRTTHLRSPSHVSYIHLTTQFKTSSTNIKHHGVFTAESTAAATKPSTADAATLLPAPPSPATVAIAADATVVAAVVAVAVVVVQAASAAICDRASAPIATPVAPKRTSGAAAATTEPDDDVDE